MRTGVWRTYGGPSPTEGECVGVDVCVWVCH